MQHDANQGFTLLEVLIAAAILAGAITSLTYVVIQSTAQSARAEHTLTALTLAQAKLEELRAAEFRFDAAGARVTSPALATVATDTLVDESAAHVELLDRFGAVVSDEGQQVYRRRWSIAASGDPDTLNIAVCIIAADSAAASRADACVWAVRTRQP